MEHILDWFTQYGYLILFIGLYLEFLFLPFPGGTVMAVSGILAHQGELDFGFCVFLATSGTSLGMMTTYIIGRKVGWPFFEKYGHRIFMGEKRREVAEKWFERFGSKVVLVSFFIPGVRHFTGYISGLVKLRFRKFFLYMICGAFLWVVTFTSLGYFFGKRWEEIIKLIQLYGLPLLGVGIVVMMIYFYRKSRLKRKR